MAIVIIVFSWCYRILFLYLFDQTGKEIYNILSRQFFGQLSFFYAGMLMYFYRDFVKRHCYKILVISLPVYFLYNLIPLGNVIIAPLAVTAVVISLSMSQYTIPGLQHKNNISYNLYLLHFPVFQLAVYFGIGELTAYSAFAIAAGATVFIAYVGNRLVDRRVFALKRFIR